MAYTQFACVFFGAGLGATLRWQFTVQATRLYPDQLFLGTLAANLVSCFIVGVAAEFFGLKSHLPAEWRLLFITGFCGGMSTLAALSVETLNLYRMDAGWAGALTGLKHLMANACGALLLCWLGMMLARRVWG